MCTSCLRQKLVSFERVQLVPFFLTKLTTRTSIAGAAEAVPPRGPNAPLYDLAGHFLPSLPVQRGHPSVSLQVGLIDQVLDKANIISICVVHTVYWYAKIGRYGRCAILSKGVLIFGPCTLHRNRKLYILTLYQYIDTMILYHQLTVVVNLSLNNSNTIIDLVQVFNQW